MTHPSDEHLAAFIDGRISDETMVEHLADCADCRDIVMTATEMKALDANVKQAAGRFGAGNFFWPLAAAAVFAAVFLIPEARYKVFGYSPETLIAASETLEERSTEGRISLQIPHKKFSRTRGGKDAGPGVADDSLHAEDARVAIVLGNNENAWRPNLRTRGLAQLLIADTRPEYDAAVEDLEVALARANDRERDEIAMDLAAALLGRNDYRGDDAEQKDAKRALSLAEDVWRRTKSPEAAWNRAVALTALDRTAEATAVWNEYLRLDPNSEWATEARGYLKKDAELGTLP